MPTPPAATSRATSCFGVAFVLALALLAVLAVPGSARADTGDPGAKRATRHPKRRAAVLDVHGRDRVGSGARRGEPPPTAISVGSPSEGHLENGAHLDTGKYIHVVAAYQRGDVRWGHPALTHLLERGARAVAKRWPGSTLDVGDLSRKNGGDLWRHHSHESGRDADVAFFVSDAKGKPLHAPHFVRFDSALRGQNFAGARLDEARTWAFVQAILTDPAAHVSHIFVSEPIRQRLLAHARAHGVSPAVWMRAATTMMQPSDSEAHDDHMHIRISCPSTNRGTCQEIAQHRVVHHPHAVAHKAAMRPSVLVTPRRPPSAPPNFGRSAVSAPPPRPDDIADDLGPLGHGRTRPW